MIPTSRTIEHPLRDEKITFLETSSETDGKYTLIEVELGPGKAAPKHKHVNQTEKFTSVSGKVSVEVDKNIVTLNPGESASAPAGSVHTFSNPTQERCVFKVLIEPGNPGWENTMRMSFGLVAAGETNGDLPKDFTTIALLVTMGEANLPGLFSLLGPVFRWRANSQAARMRGKELLERFGGTPMKWTTPNPDA